MDPTLLPQTAEYALRAMAALASQPTGQGMRAADLSEATGIPHAYLSKILRRLVLEGLLESQKGHGGGFILSRAPAKIGFDEVLRAADFTPRADQCAFGWGACGTAHTCPLHPTWSRLKGMFFEWSKTTSLADVDTEAIMRNVRSPALVKIKANPKKKRASTAKKAGAKAPRRAR